MNLFEYLVLIAILGLAVGTYFRAPHWVGVRIIATQLFIFALIVVGFVGDKRRDQDQDEVVAQVRQVAHQNHVILTRLTVERAQRLAAINGAIFFGCKRDNAQDLLLGHARPRNTLTPHQQTLVDDLNDVPKCTTVVKNFLKAANANPDTRIAGINPDKKGLRP